MKQRIVYLCLLLSSLLLLSQCDDSVTQSSNDKEESAVSQTTLITPEIGSDQSSSLTFRWAKGKNTNSYKFQLSATDDFSSIRIDSTADSTSINIKGLPVDSTFYWRVRPAVSAGGTSWSESWHFNVTNESQDVFLLSPANGAKNRTTSVELKWEKFQDAKNYNIQIAIEEDFKMLFVDAETEEVSYQTSDLEYSEDFYWRVKPLLSNKKSEWSEVFKFSTEDGSSKRVPAPNIVGPEDTNGQVDITPKFNWKRVDNAQTYVLHVSHGEKMVVEKRISETEFEPKDHFDTNATYYWRVKAEQGNWSDVHSFTTTDEPAEPLSSPEPVTPEGDASEVALQPYFEWEHVEGADSYTLHLSEGDEMELEKQVDENSFTLSEKLSKETIYYWRVRAENGGTPGEWSKVFKFKTTSESASPPAAPDQLAPEHEATGTSSTPTFKWNDIENADKYTLHVSQGDNSVIQKELENNSYTPPESLDGETTYYWRVQASTGSSSGEWSDVHSFTTAAPQPLDAPLQTSPKNKATDVSLQPSIEWEGVKGASSYSLHVSRGEEMIVKQEVDGTNFNFSEDLDAEVTYYWRVRAIGNGLENEWSDVHSFTTKDEKDSRPIPTVNLISPAHKAESQPISLELEWKGLAGIVDYRVQFSNDRSFARTINDQVVSNTIYEVSDLENNQTYYWRVQAEGDGNVENWSDIRSFSTRPDQVRDDEDESNLTSERQALMDLYTSSNGDRWRNNSGWGEGEPSSSWHGIEVNNRGEVTRIDLFNNGLRGQLPESIGSLKNVRYLNLKGNQLSGRIPRSIGNMTDLEWLILSGRTYEIGGTQKEPPENLNYGYHPGKYSSSTNRFNGIIPAEIGNLSNLQYLEISDQPDIDGPLPREIGNLTQLKGLYLNMLNLDGYEIPRSFRNLTQLRHLYISSSDVVGSLPDISGMTELRWLTITSSETLDKGLTGTLPNMRNLHKLRGLFLNNNELEGEYPAYFNNGNFTELHTIGFSWNNLTGELHGLENLPNMESLTLSGNKMSGSIKRALATMPERIQIFSVGWNNFTGDIPQNGYPNFKQLKTLYLNDNNLSGSISCSFWNNLDNDKLIYAWLKNNSFTSNCTGAMNNVDGEGSRLSIDVSGNNF